MKICPKCHKPFEVTVWQAKKVFCTTCRHDRAREYKAERDRARGAAEDEPAGYPEYVLIHLREDNRELQCSRDADPDSVRLSRSCSKLGESKWCENTDSTPPEDGDLILPTLKRKWRLKSTVARLSVADIQEELAS